MGWIPMPKATDLFCQEPCEHTDCASIRPAYELAGNVCTLGCGKPIEEGQPVYGWFAYVTDRPGDLRHATCAWEREEVTDSCAVAGCLKQGKSQTCPYDGRLHHHGCIHYDCGHPVSALTFRPDGWWKVCDEHYAILKAEREAWMAERHPVTA